MITVIRTQQAINLFDLLVMEPRLLDGYVVDSRVERSTLNTHIRSKLGNRFPVFTRCSEFMFTLNDWFDVNKLTISKLLDTLEFEYNPIDNYNRIEDSKRDYDFSGKKAEQEGITSNTKESEGTVSRNESGTTGKSTTGQTTKNYKSVFNADDFQPISQSDTKTESSNSIDMQSELTQDKDTNTDFTQGKDVIGNESGDNHTVYHSNIRGNIGVTTTQKMIEEERDIVQFNIYDWIVSHIDAELFLQRF